MVTLSVIIPCYNNGEYLQFMLDCFLRQTVDYWEVVVVDDRSTDNTPAIVKSYVHKDHRIKFFQRDREPKGSVVCRNIGFDHSIGKYICHLDADDLISDTFVEHRVKYMEEHPDVDYASFPAISFLDGNPLPKWAGKADFGVSKGNRNLLCYFLESDYPFSVWCNIYRRDSIKLIKWDEKVKIYTDFSFIVPCIFAGLKHQFSDYQGCDYYYRLFVKNKGSINMCSNFISQDKCDSTIYLFNKIITSIKNSCDSKILLNCFATFVILHYKRLLLTNNVKEINRYIEMIEPTYPELAQTFYELKDKVLYKTEGHFNQARFHFFLYRAFGNKYNRKMFIHELVKWILMYK